MNRRIVLALPSLVALTAAAAEAQTAPPRAIRRDIPMTNSIRLAHSAGTPRQLRHTSRAPRKILPRSRHRRGSGDAARQTGHRP